MTKTGRPRHFSPVTVVVTSAAVAVAGWLGWLGWHEKKHRVPGTLRIEGPYAPWQVIGLIVTLVVCVAVFAWLGFGRLAVVSSSAATTVMFSLDAGSQPTIGANMWPAGAMLLMIGALFGLGVVALLVSGTRIAYANLRDWRQSRSMP